VARFDDTGQRNERTAVGVLRRGEAHALPKPDETYLRLRTPLTKKHKQLPKDSPGIILLDISDLAPLMVDQFTIERTLYGDMVVVLGAAGEEYPHDLPRKTERVFHGNDTGLGRSASEDRNRGQGGENRTRGLPYQ
jgi:hypothetical protein